MRRIAIKVLALFRRITLMILKIRGTTESDIANQRIVSGKAWEEFCDTLKAAGAAMVFPGTPKDPFNQAEGYRYLTRLTRAGLMAFVEYADPNAPVLHRVADEVTKLGADSPDNYYQTAALDGNFDYLIRGKRNTVTYLGFGTQEGHYGEGGGMPPSGYIEADEIEMDADGNFELTLSSTPHEKNWLPMQPDTGTLIVRQTFSDRQSEIPADLTISRINCEDAERSPSNLTAKRLDDGLRSASTLVAGASLLFAKWVNDFQKHSNQLPMFDPDRSNDAGGDPNIIYYHSHWNLAEDEALVIEVTPPECEFWNFQLSNYWMESLDYRFHNIHTNNHLAHYESDGSVRIIVAHQDPHKPNWLNTTGHTSGTMCFRWVRADDHPQPQTRTIKFTDL